MNRSAGEMTTAELSRNTVTLVRAVLPEVSLTSSTSRYSPSSIALVSQMARVPPTTENRWSSTMGIISMPSSDQYRLYRAMWGSKAVPCTGTRPVSVSFATGLVMFASGASRSTVAMATVGVSIMLSRASVALSHSSWVPESYPVHV